MMLGRPDGEPPDGAGERLLASAAFRMTRDRHGAVSRAELLSAEPGPPAAATLDGLLAGGLLVERERDVYELAHPALREYLAARHIRDGGLDQVLVEAVDDPWWREVTLLSYAGAGADRIVRAGLASGTPAALSLAFACAGTGLAPELQVRLDRILLAAFDADADSDRRRLAAGVLASGQLSRLVATPPGARVCPDPVVTSLYSLFLADTGTPRPEGPCPADPATARVVTGAWSRDTVRFVAWLNETAGGPPHRYRLPTRDELDQLANGRGPAVQILSSVARRTWTRDTAAGAPQLWRSDGPPAVPIRRIHDQAANEMRRSTVLRTMLARTVAEACRDLGTAMEPIAERSARLAELLQATRAGGTGRDRNSDVRSARGTAQEIGSDLLRARRSAVRLERALRNSASLDPDVATGIAAAISRMSIGAIVDDLTRATGLEWYVAIELDWNSDFGLAPATRTARDIAASADRALREARRASAAPYRPVESVPVVDRVLGLGPAAERGPRTGPDAGNATGAALRNATGAALRNATAAVLQPAAAGDDAAPVDRFTAALVREAVLEHEQVRVDLDSIADGVGRLARAPLHRFPAPRWAGGVIARIVAAAEPVLSRTRELTPGRAAAIRIPCLVIAAEANLCGQPELGARFVELAAAVTLVETRRENPDLLETILVAYA